MGARRSGDRPPAGAQPVDTDLSRWNAREIDAVAAALNNRPRKTLRWKTPAEALNEQLLSLEQAGVATIG